MKKFIKKLLKKFGYEILPIQAPAQPNVDPDTLAARTVNEAELYTLWSAPHPLYTPWVGHPTFLEDYAGVKQHTLVSSERCYLVSALAKYAKFLQGDFAECGVYKGGTALMLARSLRQTSKKLFLFDSFEGLPQADPAHDNFYDKGAFRNDAMQNVIDLLADYSSICEIKKGWIPHTFQGIEDRFFAFAHIDVDLYRPALDSCIFFYPRMTRGGVLLFDDYGFPACRGEKEAVDQFFSDKNEKPITLLSGQALVIKL